MVVSCSAFGCTNRRVDNTLSFHRFPLDPALRKQWVIAIKRETFTPGRNAVICSAHFKPEDYYPTFASGLKKLRENVVPSMFGFPNYNQKSKEKITETSSSSMPPESNSQIQEGNVLITFEYHSKQEEKVPVTSESRPQNQEEKVPVASPSHRLKQDENIPATTSRFLMNLPPRKRDLIWKLHRATYKLTEARRNLKNAKARNVRLKEKLIKMKAIILELKRRSRLYKEKLRLNKEKLRSKRQSFEFYL